MTVKPHFHLATVAFLPQALTEATLNSLKEHHADRKARFERLKAELLQHHKHVSLT